MRVASAVAVAVLAVLAAGTLTACSPTATVSTTAGPTAVAAPASVATLSAAEFAAALKRPETVTLDVRTAEEFASGHLPNAVNIDVNGAGFAAQVAVLDPAKSYAVYCRSGNRSAVAMQAMQQLGFTRLYHLGGGIAAWTAAGGDVVKG